MHSQKKEYICPLFHRNGRIVRLQSETIYKGMINTKRLLAHGITLLLTVLTTLPLAAQTSGSGGIFATEKMDGYLTLLSREGAPRSGVADTVFVPVVYQVNKYDLIPCAPIDSVTNVINSVMNNRWLTLDHVWIGGSASPEGPLEWNKELGHHRSTALAEYLLDHTSLTRDLIVIENLEEDWAAFFNIMKQISFPNREQILGIIITENDREVRKKKIYNIDNGWTWHKLIREVFPPLRNARLSVVCKANNPLANEAPMANNAQRRSYPYARIQPDSLPTISPKPLIFAVPVTTRPYTGFPRVFLKTNFVLLAATADNLGLEVQWSPRWSAELFYSHCGWNWLGHETIKFRHFIMRPELRYWVTGLDGFFVGVHAQGGFYNVAIDGKWRYQDKEGRTPSFGGGLDLGYRMRLGGPWKLEFTVGAGASTAEYDRFYNYDPTVTGKKHDLMKKTYIGLDNVGINLSYHLNYKKWRNRR